jgi:hypothetical protein
MGLLDLASYGQSSLVLLVFEFRNRKVGTVTTLQAGQPRNRGSIPGRGKKDSSRLRRFQTDTGAHLAT